MGSVMELGATHPRGLIRAFKEVYASERLDAFVVWADASAQGYQPLEGVTTWQRMTGVARLLDERRASCGMFKAEVGYAMAYRSAIKAERFYWYGKIVDSASGWIELVRDLMRFDDLQLISYSEDDSLDLDRQAQVTPQTYPWTDSRVVTAAVRDAQGNWDQRNGQSHRVSMTPLSGPNPQPGTLQR